MTTTIPKNAEPVLLVRLRPTWTTLTEELETGYFRRGHGWRDGITEIELRDAARGWWVLSANSIKARNVDHIVAVVGDRTRAVYRIDAVIGPRSADGRFAFECTSLRSGPLFDQYVGPDGKTAPFTKGSSNPIMYWPPIAK